MKYWESLCYRPGTKLIIFTDSISFNLNVTDDRVVGILIHMWQFQRG